MLPDGRLKNANIKQAARRRICGADMARADFLRNFALFHR
jgi:hypothetical protein